VKKLENIGFYTLNDERARCVNTETPLQRCELILTNSCNFSCDYCRGPAEGYNVTKRLDQAKSIVDTWAEANLKNIRFSGGEPTIWRNLVDLVKYTKSKGVQRIALSTNGSASYIKYLELIEAGVNDLSISLDACCASTGDEMSGVDGSWKVVTDNIRALSKICYVTVGVVLTPTNMDDLNGIIKYASEDLGATDIRIISAAQWDAKFKNLFVEDSLLNKHPILKYRVENFRNGVDVRGIGEEDNHSCPLVLDDMAVNGSDHFPCIIYMREHGKAIGSMNKSITEIRKDRESWFRNHNTFKDDICRSNCLDVCVDYNNKVRDTNKELEETGGRRKNK